MKILLIEDEAYLRQSLFLMLTAEGYDVMSAEDGSIGVDLARIEAPDVVICDLRMPRLNGDEVLLKLRREPRTKTVPFIVISADDPSLAPDPIKALGSQNFLRKPFSRSDLLQAIARNQKPLAIEAPKTISDRTISRHPRHQNTTPTQPQLAEIA